jgi:hypothetical protein
MRLAPFTPSGEGPSHGRRRRVRSFAWKMPDRSALLSTVLVLLLGTIPVLVPMLVMRDGPGAITQGPRAGGHGAPTVPDPSFGTPLPTTSPTTPPTAVPTSRGLQSPSVPNAGTLSPGAVSRSSAPAAPSSTAARPSATPTTPPVGPATLAGGMPDLIVLSVSWSPAQPQPGDQVVFSAVVRNVGTAPTATIGVAFNVDYAAATWAGVSSQPLAAGAQRTFVADGSDTGPYYWTAKAGSYLIQAHVDDVNRIPESNEINNYLNRDLTI